MFAFLLRPVLMDGFGEEIKAGDKNPYGSLLKASGARQLRG